MVDQEIPRQIFHIIIGLIIIIMLAYLGREVTIIIAFLGAILGSILINRKATDKSLWFFENIYQKFERQGGRLPGWGAAWYMIGVLLIMVFLKNTSSIAACVFVFAMGDGFSTLIGMLGKIKLPYNSKKTLEGTIAFFFTSTPAYIFIKEPVIILALIGAIVESLPLDIEDNMLVPVALVITLYVLGIV
ncbi:MAG: hypothetical protein Q7S22_08075 [Candidatus Micrarchaeota archaeon]|nr:hypothetical protein [Candidatus Micrarchaeota archaeon]